MSLGGEVSGGFSSVLAASLSVSAVGALMDNGG